MAGTQFFLPRPAYTSDDISRVQRVLVNFVPAELVDAIIDMAEYWPWVGVLRNSIVPAYSALDAPDKNSQWCYLVTPRIPAIERKGVRVPTVVKKVKFMVKTHEPCWGRTDASSGPADEFKTWFEASILKKDDPGPQVTSYEDSSCPINWFSNLVPQPRYTNNFRDSEHPWSPVDNPLDSRKWWHVTDNPQSTKDKCWHEIVWNHDDQPANSMEIRAGASVGTGLGFINSLSVNDRILLMARALSPGWTNTGFNIKMEIYYALSSSYL